MPISVADMVVLVAVAALVVVALRSVLRSRGACAGCSASGTCPAARGAGGARTCPVASATVARLDAGMTPGTPVSPDAKGAGGGRAADRGPAQGRDGGSGGEVAG